MCTFFPLLPMLLRSLALPASLLSFPVLFPLFVLNLGALCIHWYPKQFLEVLGLFVARFREPASLQAGARRCFLRLFVGTSGLLQRSGGFAQLLGGSSVLVFRPPCPPVQEFTPELGSPEVGLSD